MHGILSWADINRNRNIFFVLRDLPEGYIHYNPTQEDIPQINDEWEHGQSPESEEFLRFGFEQLHKAGIKYKDGSLVAYELQYSMGIVGPLYVKPEHRRKGLAQCVMAALNRKIMLDGKPVYCGIVKGNDASVNLHLKAGFELVKESEGYRWCHYCPIVNQD